MTVSFVGSASAEATSLTLPAHQAGDLIILCAARTATTPAVAMPAGWTAITYRAGATLQTIAAWKIATSAAETSGTWTNAGLLAVGVWRHTTRVLVRNGMSRVDNVASTSITFPALLNETQNTGLMTNPSWVCAFALSASNALDFEVAPTGMTNRTSIAGASTGELALHDTNGTTTSWAGATRTASGSAQYHTIIISIEPTNFDKASSGGLFVAGGLTGGMRG